MTIDDDPDDRTHRLATLVGATSSLAALSTRRILIELGDEAARSETAKLAFLTVCNLATRLGSYLPRLDISAPDVSAVQSRVYPVGATLREQATWILNSATKTGGLHRGVVDGHPYDLAIVIGAPSAPAAERIFAGWENWSGSVGPSERPWSENNAIGACVAAAMAVSRLHGEQLRRVGGQIPLITSEWRLNALTLGSGSETIAIPTSFAAPRTLLVGAGALGSSFSYLLTHIPELKTNVDAVDHDVLKPTNANRQITAPLARADGRTPKVDDLFQVWPAITPIHARYEALKPSGRSNAEQYEIVVTAVDSAEVRREVATDLPRIIIDGATGGLTIFLMRGEDPAASCVACRYVEAPLDDDGVWATRLGVSRAAVALLRSASSFDENVLSAIREKGSLAWDVEVEEGLRSEGWSYLERHRCGDAKPERELPTASVSYVSALCGFLMAAQYLAEALGSPALAASRTMWTWSDVLRESPALAEQDVAPRARVCMERHERRSRSYRNAWPQD